MQLVLQQLVWSFSVNIDRAKLNTLLKSGLNPNIKTRKQLAAHLGLDPTTLTRWFSSRDSLGNPRHPVVPDRHVARLLALFELDPKCLILEQDEFRQYCFDASLLHVNKQEDEKKRHEARLEKISKRQLDIQNYVLKPAARRNLPFRYLTAGLFLMAGVFGYVFISDSKSQMQLAQESTFKIDCWQGYSDELGEFKDADRSDPCHYAKLFQNGLDKLRQSNSNHASPVIPDRSAKSEYLIFLSKQLDQRRLEQKITLNLELGKFEYHRNNYVAAQEHLLAAKSLLSSELQPSSELLAQISHYLNENEIKLKNL